ncbi:MAG: DUF4390 domain-containing protein [Desulfobacteraceae bacterium]
MKYHFSKKTVLVLTTLFLLLSHGAAPGKIMAKKTASIENIIITNTRDDLISYFDVNQAFTKKMKQAVLNGIPATFSFFISIYRPRDAWFDKKIAEKEIRSTLKYNSLKENFTISRPWSSSPTSVTDSFDEAKRQMTKIDSLRVVPLDELTRNEQYQLRIKARLDRVTLPLYLHHVFFFLSWWDFETNWHTVDFVY